MHVQGSAHCDGLDPWGGERGVLIHHGDGRQVRRRPGIEPSDRLVLPGEITDCAGIAVTTLARAAYDEMRMARGIDGAVTVGDMAVSTVVDQSRTTVGELSDLGGRHHKTRGIVQFTRALPEVSRFSASPWETLTRRLAQRDAGLEHLLVNVPLFDLRGTLLGVADLLDRTSGLVIESDGEGHRLEAHHARTTAGRRSSSGTT